MRLLKRKTIQLLMEQAEHVGLRFLYAVFHEERKTADRDSLRRTNISLSFCVCVEMPPHPLKERENR